MDRRHFLTSASMAWLAACTNRAETESGSGTSTPVRDANGTASSSTVTTAGTATAAGTGDLGASDPPTVEPVATPDPGVRPDDDPFPLGVASGDPASDSVVLWTKVSVASLTVDVALAWDISTDEGFDTVVASGVATAAALDNQTVRVVAGSLPPDRRLWYRFRVGDRVSTTGRSRTLPDVGADPSGFGIAVSSCQDRTFASRWDVHDVLAADDDVALVVWLGDFIYESGAETLTEYRERYATCRRDPRLQSSSAAHPWIATWDDHEVVNNYDASVDPARRLHAYTAWWEHMPTRLPKPTLDGLAVYRSFDVGRLGRIVLLDCRQYQTGETVLGSTQLEWLVGQLAHSGRRTVLASPVVMSSLGVGGLVPDYGFEAHPAEQAEIVGALRTAPSPRVVSGDLHSAMRLHLAPGIEEWMAPPISSSFPERYADLLPFLPIASESVESAEVRFGYLFLDLADEDTTPAFRP